MPRVATTLSTRSNHSRPGTTDVPNAWATPPAALQTRVVTTSTASGRNQHSNTGYQTSQRYRRPISISAAAANAVTVRTWFHAVQEVKYACHSRAVSAADSPTRIDTIEVVVRRNVERDRDDRCEDADDRAGQHPPAAGLAQLDRGDDADHDRRAAAPKYASRKAALEFASALMPRITVIASTGSVPFKPHMTKVENTYIIPPAAALPIAAIEVRMTEGLVFMIRSQPGTAARAIVRRPDPIRVLYGR